jgi:hypothetical protein
MRFRRTVLLGLSPLLSLLALGAQVSAERNGMAPGHPVAAQAVHHRFLEPVVSFLILAAGQAHITAPETRPAPQLALGLDALRFTPLGRSLWLLQRQSPAASRISARGPLPLRC